MNIIELKDISKSFSGRKVLNQINLSIKKGDIVGLIGIWNRFFIFLMVVIYLIIGLYCEQLFM